MTIAFAGPVLPGMEERWRRFLQEIEGSRLAEYAEFQSRLGVRVVAAWISRTSEGEVAIASVEAEDPWVALLTLANSDHPFDIWLKERLLEFHGLDLPKLRQGHLPELVFSPRTEQRSVGAEGERNDPA